MKLSRIVIFICFASISAAIKCDFRYTAKNISELRPATHRYRKPIQLITVSDTKLSKIFECEDDDELFSNRNHFDLDFDVSGSPSCESHKELITPKAMSNTRNQMVDVFQSSMVIQSITTEKCTFKGRSCGSEEGAAFQHRCKQVMVEISLQASDGLSTYRDTFYYPSNCICDLVRVKST